MTEPNMRMVNGDGIRLNIAEWSGSGKTILAIHGLTANCRTFDVLADELTPDYRLLAVDLRGRGLSDSPPSGYSVKHHCRDILAMFNDQGLDRVILIGHSLGAIISLFFAAEYPERVEKIVLIDAGGVVTQEQAGKFFEGIKASLDRLGQVYPSFEEYLDLMKQAPFFKEFPPSLEAYYAHEMEAVEGGFQARTKAEHIQEEIINNASFDITETYAKIKCPVLILRATEGLLSQEDLLLPEESAKTLKDAIPDSRLVSVIGSNHYTVVLSPHGERDKAIREFLED